MERTWAIMRKEFLHILRDWRTLSLIIALPILMLIILGTAVANDIKNIPMVIADQSHTDASRKFIERFTNSTFFQIANEVDNEGSILESIDRGQAQAGLLIPVDFGQKLETNQTASVQVYMDASDPTIAQVMQMAVETIIQRASADQQIKVLSHVLPVQPNELYIDARQRFLYNPDMRRLNFLIPALAATIMQVQTLLLTGFAIVREREQGTLEQLIVTPIQPWELMLGKILPFVLIGFVNLFVTLGLGSLWFQVPITGSIGLLALLSLLFLLGSLGLGILISIIARTQIQAMHIAMFINLPSLILSGFVFPRFNMPPLAYYAGYFLPLTYFVDIIRGIVLKGIGISMLWGSIIPLAVYSIVVFLASILLFRKRLE